MMEELLKEIRACRICEDSLPFGCRPVMSAAPSSKILIVGQAPGRIVHSTGIPWDDKSGENLRSWMGIDSDTFYDTSRIAILPMGFCYPGTGKSGDLPPRKECAPEWHTKVLEKLPNLELTLLIGAYAQKYYLQKKRKKNLTETVMHYAEYLPEFIPLPHPSPRNNIWQKKHPWFKAEILPVLQEKIETTLG